MEDLARCPKRTGRLNTEALTHSTSKSTEIGDTHRAGNCSSIDWFSFKIKREIRRFLYGEGEGELDWMEGKAKENVGGGDVWHGRRKGGGGERVGA